VDWEGCSLSGCLKLGQHIAMSRVSARLYTPFTVEVCMGVGNPMGIPFPWESHGYGNSHTAHDGSGNGNGNKANGNGNSIYFTRIKIPKIIVMI